MGSPGQKGGFFRLDGRIVTIVFAIGMVMALIGLLRRGRTAVKP